MLKVTSVNLLIASSRKTHNSQSLDSRNQNTTYGIGVRSMEDTCMIVSMLALIIFALSFSCFDYHFQFSTDSVSSIPILFLSVTRSI